MAWNVGTCPIVIQPMEMEVPKIEEVNSLSFDYPALGVLPIGSLSKRSEDQLQISSTFAWLRAITFVEGHGESRTNSNKVVLLLGSEICLNINGAYSSLMI